MKPFYKILQNNQILNDICDLKYAAYVDVKTNFSIYTVILQGNRSCSVFEHIKNNTRIVLINAPDLIGVK